MKCVVAITILFINALFYAQTPAVVGTYSKTMLSDDTKFEHVLELKADDTFSFRYFSYIKNGIPTETVKEGRGRWTEANNIVTFTSDEEIDINEKNALNFTNSKARFIMKSPRDQSDKIVPTKLQFLQSDIKWLARIDLLKVAN